MEHAEGNRERIARLKSFERAGFLKIDPTVIDYNQPDFRDPEVIDSSGGPRPLPFQLLIRRVGREAEDHASSTEVRYLVDRLYRVYARDFRAQDMSVVWQLLHQYPAAGEMIRLVPPTD